MSELVDAFNLAAREHFGTFARETGLELEELRDGVFEICSAKFCLRLRFGTGHGVDFLVTLTPRAYRRLPLEENEHEIGLGVIFDFYSLAFREKRGQLQPSEIDGEIKRLADAARIVKPILSDGDEEWGKLERFVEEKKRRAEEGIRKRFPNLS